MKMNICHRRFTTRLAADEWIARQVVRRTVETAYVLSVKDLDNRPVNVEVLDTANPGYEPRQGDERLAKLARIEHRDGIYRVGVPA